jgi:hypothetical protein
MPKHHHIRNDTSIFRQINKTPLWEIKLKRATFKFNIPNISRQHPKNRPDVPSIIATKLKNPTS